MDLLELIMQGQAGDALNELSSQYGEGADPHAVIRDLAEAAHWLSILKVSPDTARDVGVAPDQADRGVALANSLPMRALSRSWQMLLKVIEEMPLAPSPIMAAEMAVIRLCYVAELPSAEELLRRLSREEKQPPQTGEPVATQIGETATTAGDAKPRAAPQHDELTQSVLQAFPGAQVATRASE